MPTGTEVGNGHVLITPVLDKEAMNAVEAQGGKSGGLFGGKFGGAFSVAAGALMATAVTKIADMAAEQFQQAFTNIMDYEQLAGGAQKIFDQIDYSVIARDAQNAFKELNMSANEYIASINMAGAAFAQTMGDEKGYAVAREGMLAISDYATGTGRNIEELNQKYQMITRSASSYQSIADQFAGILPATSKDFLEQAKAAGYLSDEYQNLTDVPVAEYQEAVTKMLTKGVDDLGLAANTLHESESTMSGSLAMLSSSWQNFLTALGGGEGWDMQQVTDDLIQSLGAVAQNIIPALGRIGQSIAVELPRIIGENLTALAPTVREALVNAFGENAGEAFDAFGEAVGRLQDIFGRAFTFIQDTVTAVMPVVQQAITPVAEFIGTAVIGFLNALIFVLENVMTFLESNVLPVVQAVSSFIQETVMPVVQDIVDGVSAAMPVIQSAFETVMGAIFAVVQEVWPPMQELITTVLTTIQDIVQTVWPVVQDIITTVFNTVRGIAEAVWPVISGVVSTAANVIKTAISGISAIVGGIRNTFNAIKEAITNPIETAKNAISNAVNAIKGFFSGLRIEIPKPRIPRITVDGGEAPWGIGGQGRLPSFDVQWARLGGFVGQPTLLGAGEAYTEMVLPRRGGLMNDFADAVTERVNTAEVVAELRALRGEVQNMTVTPRELHRINQKVNAYA